MNSTTNTLLKYSLWLCVLCMPTAVDAKTYELQLQTNSDWTRIEIRDDAEWINAPEDQFVEVSSKKGIKSFSMSRKTMFIKTNNRSEVNMKLFINSEKNVLGINICKGSASSYTWVQSEQSKQKNDVKKKDYCEKAALVLKLY